ncbi:HAD hydrolase-like protein [Salipaludibacillus neizhouensis]|nr:HAD hydrolase-like protein [Salipaludibacillus neizhouensis]
MKSLDIHNTIPFEIKNIKAIVFDLDGTIYPAKQFENQIKPNMVKHAAKTLNIDEESARKTLALYRKEFRSSVLGLQKYHEIDPKIFLESVFNDIDTSSALMYPGLLEELQLLSTKKSLKLLTNSNYSHAEKMVTKFNLTNVFDNIYSVDDWNFIRKPNIEVFDGLVERLNLPSESILIVDDSYLNLEIAHHKGMRTMLVSNQIVEAPYYWEMHKREKHLPQSFIDLAAHNITTLVKEINNVLIKNSNT